MPKNVSQLPSSRRSIIKGAAWSVPVVALATAAPAHAASGDPEPSEAVRWGANFAGSVRNDGKQVGYIGVNGINDDGEPGPVPAGFVMMLTPPEGVTITITRKAGILKVVEGADGTLTIYALEGSINPKLSYTITGPTGGSIIWSIAGPIDPLTASGATLVN